MADEGVAPIEQGSPARRGRGRPRLARSQHLSLFLKRPHIFIHHDLIGDIVRADPVLVEFLDFFQPPRDPSEAVAAFASRIPEADVKEIVRELLLHRCLVPEGLDEQADAAATLYPIAGPWTFCYRPKDGDAVLGWKDRRAGGGPRFATLDTVERAAWGRCTGTATAAEVAKSVAADLPGDRSPLARRALELIFRLTHSDVQAVKLIPRPAMAFAMSGLPPYALSTMPYPRLEPGQLAAVGASGGAAAGEAPRRTDLTGYHVAGIGDAERQFELEETTLSHAFRVPHPALDGMTFGERLAEQLIERGLLPAARPLRVLEIGGGLGYVARDLASGLARRDPALAAAGALHYVLVELSPALQGAQRRLLRGGGGGGESPAIALIRGHALRLPVRDASVDLVLANEMAGDLETVRLTRAEARGDASPPPDAVPALALARELDLDLSRAPDPFHLNAGAILLVREIARVLRPGGRAVVTEFGSTNHFPIESDHLDHAEFSVHFGHLARAAEAAGLETMLESLPKLLRMHDDVPVLAINRSFFEVLRAFLHERGVELTKLAWTPDALRELLARSKIDMEAIEGLRFDETGDRVLGLVPSDFGALVLHRK